MALIDDTRTAHALAIQNHAFAEDVTYQSGVNGLYTDSSSTIKAVRSSPASSQDAHSGVKFNSDQVNFRVGYSVIPNLVNGFRIKDSSGVIYSIDLFDGEATRLLQCRRMK